MDPAFVSGLALNNRGDVVGQIWRDCCTYGGYVISDGKLRRLPTLGGDYSFANAINNSGLIVGRSWTADMRGYQAVVYRGNDIQSLGTLGGIFANARARVLDRGDAGGRAGRGGLDGHATQENRALSCRRRCSGCIRPPCRRKPLPARPYWIEKQPVKTRENPSARAFPGGQTRLDALKMPVHGFFA